MRIHYNQNGARWAAGGESGGSSDDDDDDEDRGGYSRDSASASASGGARPALAGPPVQLADDARYELIVHLVDFLTQNGDSTSDQVSPMHHGGLWIGETY